VIIQWETKKYFTARTVAKSNEKIVETGEYPSEQCFILVAVVDYKLFVLCILVDFEILLNENKQ
jgi:hypothetical protein